MASTEWGISTGAKASVKVPAIGGFMPLACLVLAALPATPNSPKDAHRVAVDLGISLSAPEGDADLIVG
jgi:hypothetical protein